MRYSMIAAALLGLAIAMPYAEEKHDDKKVDHKDDHKDDKKDEWNPAPVKDDKDHDKKDHDDKDKHDDKKDDKKDEWKPEPVKDDKKKDEWKPEPVKDDKKDEWKPAPAPTPKPWAPAPVEEKKCSYTTVYTTKECGKEKEKWDNCKDVTKTSTVYPEKCTWGEAKAPEKTWAPAPVKPEEKTTWAEVKTPEAAATWAPAPVKPAPAASSTVWAPVAKWTGAADKQAVGMGALAIAAVAALL